MSEFNYTKENPLRVFTAFSGYDSQCMSLDRIGIPYELVGWSEIDKYAIQGHNAVYPQYADKNYGDISKINWEEVPDFDLFTYSFPCFVSGTLVLTKDGFVNIEEMTTEDYVLTHTNNFRKVVKPMVNSYRGELYRIKAMAFDTLVCTPEHPFYTRRRYKKWNNPIRRWERLFYSPEWVNAKDLTKDHYLGVAINQLSELPKWEGVEDNRWGHHRPVNALADMFGNPSFWYLMGRYVGDGWKKESRSGKGVVICCGGRNEDKLVEAFNECGISFTKTSERTVRKYTVSSNELYTFVDRYGYYAHGKKIDAETMALPKPMLGAFLEGYFDADGSFDGTHHKATSVSRELVYGIGQCVAKVHQTPYRIYRTARKPKTVIEGRSVNQRDSYQIVFKTTKDKQDKAFYEDGYIWFPISDINTEYAECPVYNMEVEEDNSYTANGCIVHNCTDISNAGRQKGLEEGSGTRSSLLWECRRAIEAKRPKYLMMENVKALVSKKFLPFYKQWEIWLRVKGYTNFGKVLNAKDYGVPQNRERIFLISILDEDANYRFPGPFPLETRLKDVLEEEVDDKYVLSETAIQGFLKHNENHMAKGTGFLWIPKDVAVDGGVR